MNFQLEEILTVIDRVKEADLALFEYQDADARIKIQGKQETGGIPAEEWTQGSRNGKISEEEWTQGSRNGRISEEKLSQSSKGARMPEEELPQGSKGARISEERTQAGEAKEKAAGIYTQEESDGWHVLYSTVCGRRAVRKGGRCRKGRSDNRDCGSNETDERSKCRLQWDRRSNCSRE